MSSAIRLQAFLSLIDPGLFFCIKTIRRALDVLQFDWVITGHLAINLYSYLAGLHPMPGKTLVAEIYINRFSKSDLLIESELKELIRYLEQLGFVSEKSSLEFSHPFSSTHFHFNLSSDPSLFDDQYRVWMRNKIGKATYPLLDPIRLERQQLRQVSYLSVDKKNADQAKLFASYPLIDSNQNGVECYLTLEPTLTSDLELIAPPLLQPCERSIGLSIYEWTKYVLSESLISTDEISLPSKRNRVTKNLTFTKPQLVQQEEAVQSKVLSTLELPTLPKKENEEKKKQLLIAQMQKQMQLQSQKQVQKRAQKTR